MSLIPESPPLETTDRSGGTGSAAVVMRYEDVAEDGRLLVESLATSVNETLWRVALRGHPIEAHAFAKGTLAILSRFVVEGGEGPFPVDGPFEAESRFVIARGVGASGETERLYLNAWVDTYAPIGRENFAPPEGAGQRALVGRAFAEHVFTRPFAPPGERKVTRLDLPGMDEPRHVYASGELADLLEPSAGASAVDSGLVVDPTTIAFGLRHTDSNQHVNSLVYPQLFEEASLRRFAALGLDTRELARTLEIGYRKPCFAGQRVHVALRVFRVGERLGTCGGFYAADDLERGGIATARPHAFVRMTFARSPR